MTVYAIAQLKMTDRAAYDRYQARFFDVFRKFTMDGCSPPTSSRACSRARGRSTSSS
ncbi:hypothetical protein ACVWXN_008447 [Bradyrhizobium sp. i1.4.4]